jgi:prolyl oligopeptidase
VARVVTVGAPGLVSGTVIDGTLYLRTTKGAPRGRVVAVDVRDPVQPRWRDVVSERADAVIQDVSFARGRIIVSYRKNAADTIEVFDLAGASVGKPVLPGIGLASLTATPDRTDAFVTFTSINYPPTVFRVDAMNPAAAPQLWMAPDTAGRPADVQVEQVWYPSKDGTRISMFLAHKMNLPKRGDTPTLLLGFGAFGVSVTPAFSPSFFQWFDAGGLLAWPNLRGGGEYGDAWHAAGARESQADHLRRFRGRRGLAGGEQVHQPAEAGAVRGIARRSRGRAVVTARPDLARAAILSVPVLDMLRYEHFLAGPRWVPEYGSVADAVQSQWLLAYSPYQRVKAARSTRASC